MQKSVFILSLSLIALGCSPSGNTGEKWAGQNIIGGEIVSAENPLALSTVALITSKNDILKETCSGTLISENLVLTAAHCLDGLRPSNIWIHVGAQLPKNFYLNKMVRVRDFIIHNDYGPAHNADFPGTYFNDIAVLLLDQPLKTLAKPVRIQSGASPELNTTLTLAGFGVMTDENTRRTKELRTADVRLVKMWQSILVVDQTKGSGACRGDSGGPAYIKLNDELILVGLTQGPHKRSPTCNFFVEFTDATQFKDFITESARDLGGEPAQFYTPQN